MEATWKADYWKILGQSMRLVMAGEPGTTVFKGVCPATPAEVYNPVILVRRRGRRSTFVALHVPGDRQLALKCMENEGGAILCRVSGEGMGPDLLFKQQEERAVDLAGHTWRGLLAFCADNGAPW